MGGITRIERGREPSLRILLPAIGLAALAFLGIPHEETAFAGAGRLTILHTNDIHATFLPVPATWEAGYPLLGGMVALDAAVRKIENSGTPTLLLDAGDLLTGNPISNIELAGAKGGPLVDLLNRIRYDAMVLGNHEFDHGWENVNKLVALAGFPVLAANLRRPGGEYFTGKRYVIVERDGLRVGVIGVILEDLFQKVGWDEEEGFTVEPVIDTVRELADELDPLTDLLIVLSHWGVDNDRTLARKVPAIDIIVGGHSHTRLEAPEVVNGVIMVQAGSRCRYLGRLIVTVGDDRVLTHDGELLPLWIEDLEQPSIELASAVGKYRDKIERRYGAVLAMAVVPLIRAYTEEGALGKWVADAMREYTRSDFALINSGGIRKDLAPGEVKALDIHEMLPFNNKLVVFECTGRELLGILGRNAESAAEGRGILQVSGLSYRWIRTRQGGEVLSAAVGGILVEPDSVYTGVTVDYVAISRPERYLGYKPKILKTSKSVIADVLIESARLEKVIAPLRDIRIVEVHK